MRLIGVDVQALNAQVAEKERMKQDERDMNRYDRKLFISFLYDNTAT